MYKLRDISGQRFGRLIAIKPTINRTKDGGVIWLFKCDCGNKKEISKAPVIAGKVLSCTCLMRELARSIGKSCITHGFKSGGKQHRFYSIWCNLKRRCNRQTDFDYSLYGGRGIVYEPKWNNFLGFKEDMWDSYLRRAEEVGEKNISIDRINPNGNYELSNCRWATMKEQQRNRRNNHFIELEGKRKTLAEWREYFGIKESTLNNRLRRGWPINRLFTKR